MSLKQHLCCATHCPSHIKEPPLSQLHHYTAIRKSDLNGKYFVLVGGKQSAPRNSVSFTALSTDGGGKLHVCRHTCPLGPTVCVPANIHQHLFTIKVERLAKVSFPVTQQQSGLAKDFIHQNFGLLDGLLINLMRGQCFTLCVFTCATSQPLRKQSHPYFAPRYKKCTRWFPCQYKLHFK